MYVVLAYTFSLLQSMTVLGFTHSYFSFPFEAHLDCILFFYFILLLNIHILSFVAHRQEYI